MSIEQMPNFNTEMPKAMLEINALEQQARMAGRFDSEGDAFENIRRELMAHNCTPEQALAAAHALMSGRQDYN